MDLSIIILSYNTSDLTKQCLDSVVKSLDKTSVQSEIVLVENASKDGSVDMLKEFEKKNTSKNIHLTFLYNKENTGYPKGNNQGIAVAKGRYILLLNSDVIIQNVDFKKLLEYMDIHEKIGVLTVKLNLPTGGIDPASHRGFPTPWNAFCYFCKLEKIFGKVPFLNTIFGGYHLTQFSLKKVHEIDSPAGAFFLSTKALIDKVNGFDEQYFLFAEDLDLSYKIKELGYKCIYYPHFSALHMKSQSGLKGKNTETRKKSRWYFYNSMKLFYKKHYYTKYPFFVRSVVFFVLDLIKSRYV